MLYQSEGFPWSEESVTDVRGLCGGLEKEYLTSSSQTQDSPLCVVTIVSKSDILHKNWGDFAVIGITGISVAVLTFGVIMLFAHMMSSPLTAFTRKMQDTTVRNLHEESFEIEQIPFREIQILYTEFFRMRQRLDTMIENEIALRPCNPRKGSVIFRRR